MPGQPYRVEVESLHWPTLLPSLRLFEAFKLAIHPSKLALAFLFVFLLYLGGLAFDLAWEGEPFQLAKDAEVAAFREAVIAAAALDLGADDLLTGRTGGMLGAVHRMVIRVPARLFELRPGFTLLYGLYAFLLAALFGAAITRLAALQACRDLRPPPQDGLRFAARWYVWFVTAPLLPVVVAAFVGLLLVLAGLLFFNLPGTDIVGGLLYGLLLLGGCLITLALVGLLVGVHVLYPAIAVEGTDAFDAVSRGYNYALGRPFRLAFYVLVGIVYFAITFALVSLLVYGAIALTEALVGIGAFANIRPGLERFDAITPTAYLYGDTLPPDHEALDGAGDVAAWLVRVWIGALLMLLAAYAVSFYFSISTWIYLLLRRAADGVEIEDVYLEPRQARRLGDDAAAAEPAVPSEGTDGPSNV